MYTHVLLLFFHQQEWTSATTTNAPTVVCVRFNRTVAQITDVYAPIVLPGNFAETVSLHYDYFNIKKVYKLYNSIPFYKVAIFSLFS